MKKKLLLIISILLISGCEVSLDEDEFDNNVIEKCKQDGGKAIVTYCKDSLNICKVTCELEGVSNERGGINER